MISKQYIVKLSFFHIPAYFSEIKGNDSDYPSIFLSPPSASGISAAEESKSIDALDFIYGGS